MLRPSLSCLCTLAVVAGLCGSARAQSDLQVNPQTSWIVGGGSSLLGPLQCQPSVGVPLVGDVLIELTRDAQRLLYGTVLGGRIRHITRLRLFSVDPLGIPVLDIVVDGMEFELDSDTFLIPTSGEFTTNIHGICRGGTLTITSIGNPVVIVNLDGVVTDMVVASGKLPQSGAGLHLVLPVSLRFKVPGVLGANLRIDLDFSCAIRANMLFTPTSSYCQGSPNSLGCVAQIGWTGSASATSGSGFVIGAGQVRNQCVGLLVYGFDGKATQPFMGGTLCVQSPLQRTPGQVSGGSPPGSVDCSGAYSIDLNAYTATEPFTSLLRIPGTAVHAQWWSREPSVASHAVLSNAVEFMVGF